MCTRLLLIDLPLTILTEIFNHETRFTHIVCKVISKMSHMRKVVSFFYVFVNFLTLPIFFHYYFSLFLCKYFVSFMMQFVSRFNAENLIYMHALDGCSKNQQKRQLYYLHCFYNLQLVYFTINSNVKIGTSLLIR